MVGGLRDVITCAEFQIEIFMGYDFTGGRIFDFPILAWALQQCSATALPVMHWTLAYTTACTVDHGLYGSTSCSHSLNYWSLCVSWLNLWLWLWLFYLELSAVGRDAPPQSGCSFSLSSGVVRFNVRLCWLHCRHSSLSVTIPSYSGYYLLFLCSGTGIPKPKLMLSKSYWTPL